MQGALCQHKRVSQGCAPAGTSAKGRWVCVLPSTHSCPSLSRCPPRQGLVLPSQQSCLTLPSLLPPARPAGLGQGCTRVCKGFAQGVRGAGWRAGSACRGARAQDFPYCCCCCSAGAWCSASARWGAGAWCSAGVQHGAGTHSGSGAVLVLPVVLVLGVVPVLVVVVNMVQCWYRCSAGAWCSAGAGCGAGSE